MILRLRKKSTGHAPVGVLMPPEGVPLHLKVAGLGVRLAAQITDVAITLLAAVCILILLATLKVTSPEMLMATGSLLFFVTRVPYYVMTELAWNGQTLGKRLMKIKVVSHSGGSLTTHALVLRNLMKEAEIFLPGTLLLTLDAASPIASGVAFAWIIAGLMVPLLNRHRQRLGDFMAGTHVIHLPVPVLLKDLAQAPQPRSDRKKGYAFLAHQLEHYGAFELQTLETLLRAQDRRPGQNVTRNQSETIEAVVEKIRQKISYADPVPAGERNAFLRAFYNAQRERLEQRQLFGERRKDKHYASDDSET